MSVEVGRDRNSLKEQALLERMAQIVTQYENQVAELRVELTLMAGQLKESQESVSEETPAEDSD